MITTITPIVLYIPITFLFLNIYNYSTPKTILIPENFDGKLRIVYEEKCGIKYSREDGIKTLIFPENGILILNEKFDRHINFNYYLIDKLGKKTKIPQIFNFNNRIQKRPSVLKGSSGTIGGMIEANSTNQEKKGITFSDFYVFNKDTLIRNDYKNQRKFDSLTTNIVNECRLRE